MPNPEDLSLAKLVKCVIEGLLKLCPRQLEVADKQQVRLELKLGALGIGMSSATLVLKPECPGPCNKFLKSNL